MTVEAIKERLAPALETFNETVRQGRKAIVRRQHAAEDAADAATLAIRHRPLSAVACAAGVGAIAGGLLGFGLGWLAHRR